MFRSSPVVLDDVSALDIAFVLDTTGSMTPLLQAAREHMTSLLSQLASESSLRVGFVEYRDHPPQDKLLTRVVPFSSDLKSAQKTIEAFSAQGGGDGPEAVFDGIVAATQMEWRRHARRIAVLIGDAPPHGVGARGDGFPRGCPCGETPDSVSARCEEARVTLYALGLQPDVDPHFELLAASTGGEFWSAHGGYHERNRKPNGSYLPPMERLKLILEAEAAHLQQDRLTLRAFQDAPGALSDEIAEKLGCGRGTIAASLARLGRRELI
ncbi:hypothetical protein IAD21_00288 [Abditibacteriota bacterium]|nr:hypothetical protein IAD21_00288 [Abditibacteriota bacterium]